MQGVYHGLYDVSVIPEGLHCFFLLDDHSSLVRHASFFSISIQLFLFLSNVAAVEIVAV